MDLKTRSFEIYRARKNMFIRENSPGKGGGVVQQWTEITSDKKKKKFLSNENIHGNEV